MKISKVFLPVLSLVLFIPGISGADAPASNGENGILGLWKAIDIEDGSETLLSISDNDNDGILDLHLTDTFFSSCVRDYGLNSSPGLVDGPATFQSRILSWAFALKCYNPATQSLVEVEQGNTTFEFNQRDKTLVNGDGSIFYRIDHR